MPEGIEAASWFDSEWHGGEVSSRAYAVVAPNPSWETFEGTNTWILHEPGMNGCYVVDPGPDDEAHLANVAAAVRTCGCTAKAILVTHGHDDHKLGAPRLSRMIGAPVFSRAGGNLPDGPFRMEDSPHLDVVSLPGHSGDSVGFVFPSDESAVTGDVIFWNASTAIIWPDGDLGAYMATLDTLERLVVEGGCRRFLSAHRRPVDDCIGTIADYRNRRSMRLDMVREALREVGSLDTSLLIPLAYRDVEPDYYPLCEYSIRAQLEYLKQIGDSSITRIGE